MDAQEIRASLLVLDRQIERETDKEKADEYRRLRQQYADRLKREERSGSRDLPETRGIKASGDAHDRAFERYMRFGELSGELRLADTTGMEHRDPPGFSDGSQPGMVSGSGGTFGGYMVAQDFWRNLAIAMKAYGGTAKDFKQVETETGAIMPWPTVNPTGVVTASLTAEPVASNTALTPDNPYVLGQGVLSAWPYVTPPVLVSRALVDDSAFDLSQFIADRFAESIGRGVAADAISGSGSSKPLGIVTALAAMSSTGTVGTGPFSPVGGFVTLATGGVVKDFAGTSTELLRNTINPATAAAMIASVDPAYWENAKFYLSPTQLLGLRQQVDANGRPIAALEDGLSGGSPTRLYGFDVVTDANIPSLAASTTGGPIFGDLSRAMVQRTVRGAGFLRLNERWADFWAIGYLGWLRTDIRSNDTRAACTVRAAGS